MQIPVPGDFDRIFVQSAEAAGLTVVQNINLSGIIQLRYRSDHFELLVELQQGFLTLTRRSRTADLEAAARQVLEPNVVPQTELIASLDWNERENGWEFQQGDWLELDGIITSQELARLSIELMVPPGVVM